MDVSQPPDHLPAATTPPVCWKADYAGEGAATVWVCGYRGSSSAFEAAQRMQSSGRQVKFQKGVYLAVAQWNEAASQAAVTALIGAIQRSLPNP